MAIHFDIIESLKLIDGHRNIYYARNLLHTFVCVEFRILVILSYVWSLEFLYKSEMYMKVSFSRSHYYKHVDWKRRPCV